MENRKYKIQIMEPINQAEFERIKNYIHNSREELARHGKNIIYVTAKYDIMTEKIIDINFLNQGLIRHFSTAFHPRTEHTRLYNVVMEWLIEKHQIEEKYAQIGRKE